MEEQINNLEDRMVEITASKQSIEKRMKGNENSLRDFWDNIKRINIHIIRLHKENRERNNLRKYVKT